MELYYFKSIEEAANFAESIKKQTWKRVTVSRVGYQYLVTVETLDIAQIYN